MADFSTTEKTNANWKHTFNVLGTYNGTGASGKSPFEETIPASHIIFPEDIWGSPLPTANNLSQAKAAAALPSAVVEDRSDGLSISLTAAGADWLITSTVEPKVGYQVTDQHPSPTWIKSITAVTSLGLGEYRITLNSNVGVAAGPAVLQRRMFLTVDSSTNGLAWFARDVYGNSFSNLSSNFVLPQRAGRGYAVRLFRANGIEVLTTEGAWIFNYQKGMLLFGAGYSPSNLGYAQPMYIECFRYIGAFGSAGTSLPDGDLNDTLRFDGSDWIPNGSLQSDGVDTTIRGNLTLENKLITASGEAPLDSSSSGILGEVRWDNRFLYLKTDLGWGRVSLGYFS